jgi:hypothetical protein
MQKNKAGAAVMFGAMSMTLVALIGCGGGGTSLPPQGAGARAIDGCGTQPMDMRRSHNFVPQVSTCSTPPPGPDPAPPPPISPGSGGPGGTLHGGGNCDPTDPSCPIVVARRKPTQGATCWNSPGPTLGDNQPVGNSDTNTEVVDIYAMTFTQSGGGTSAWAWLYIEKGGSVYIAENGSYKSSFEGFLGGIPGFSGIVSAIQNSHGGLVPLNSSQGQTALNNWNSQPGHTSGSCFTNPLVVT